MTDIRITQAGLLVSEDTEPVLRVTQAGLLVSEAPSPELRITQAGLLVSIRNINNYVDTGTGGLALQGSGVGTGGAEDTGTGGLALRGSADDSAISHEDTGTGGLALQGAGATLTAFSDTGKGRLGLQGIEVVPPLGTVSADVIFESFASLSDGDAFVVDANIIFESFAHFSMPTGRTRAQNPHA